ncbi:Srb5p NDAI_0G01150 [Naumovozyma dairenensis CBS 421]|uniref:Mediator of RNA polymerase II transcription subunit 18 n=1 Tax=Naumovozyma dairenensis (strain ATCC 10597 / BCRC 20456 / CBS 421 / NBRC 0211 / NRRL Y-12639) TaxID=1071378 RepID=G0WDN0_NAUDC|nr:hypothetical protein NDAI_0G01150 [Naumovozyma dairenensis CBS 421]CCD25891.2 hypothetical protein NDAI_0G01150 [Naumovozyma dairenensis CBS 421]
MVQQISLFGVIDEESYDLFISTITTLSGTSPILFSRFSTVWKPLSQQYDIDNIDAKNQITEPNRITVSKSIPFNQFQFSSSSDAEYDYKILKSLSDDTIPMDPQEIISIIYKTNAQGSSSSSCSWSLAISDIPAAGANKKVSLQTINESVLLYSTGEKSSLSDTMNALGYNLDYNYVTIGVKFYLKHELIIEVQKIWTINNNNDTANTLQVTKNGYLIKAYVDVNRSTDIDRINYTETLLLNLQRELQGYVDLVIPDRKSMDSRMSYF